MTGVSSNGARRWRRRCSLPPRRATLAAWIPWPQYAANLFGEATKFSQFPLESDKSYRVTAKLGVTTETGDADGEVVKPLRSRPRPYRDA